MSDIKVFCTITALNGVKIPVTLSADITPTALRQLVAKETKIPLDQLRLIFRGRMIKDDDTQRAVEEYKLEAESVLHCMGKPVEDVPPTDEATSTPPASAMAVNGRSGSATSSFQPLTSISAAAPSTVPNAAAAAAASFSSVPAGSNNSTLPAALLRLRMNNPPSIYQTALTTLEKILINITTHPMEEKYRKVKRQNAAFQKRLGGLVGGHDAMLAAGFVVEIQEGTEVYQLHASPEQWPRLVQAKEHVEVAVQQAKMQQAAPPGGVGMGGFPTGGGVTANGMGMGGGGLGGLASMDPNMQNAVSQMMSNPDALRAALQNPMIQDMIRNDPNVSPMMGTFLDQMANNPAMLQQVTQRMQDPAVRAQLESMMGGGGGNGMPGMVPGLGMGGMGTPGTANMAPSSQQQSSQQEGSDQDQTEDEMIAEAIRRSLEES